MKLIMAVSKDGYVARTENDTMAWTGKTDKQVFRLLTCVGGTIACGSKTWEMMPRKLAGRHMIRLSTKPYNADCPFVQDLKWYNQAQPNGWLIGGLHVATEALMMDLVDQAFICRSDRYAFPVDDGGQSGAPLNIAGLKEGPLWQHSLDVNVLDVTVQVWNRRR